MNSASRSRSLARRATARSRLSPVSPRRRGAGTSHAFGHPGGRDNPGEETRSPFLANAALTAPARSPCEAPQVKENDCIPRARLALSKPPREKLGKSTSLFREARRRPWSRRALDPGFCSAETARILSNGCATCQPRKTARHFLAMDPRWIEGSASDSPRSCGAPRGIGSSRPPSYFLRSPAVFARARVFAISSRSEAHHLRHFS